VKHCPKCRQVYEEEALKFCRLDGAVLVNSTFTEAETILFPSELISHRPVQQLPQATSSLAVLPFNNLTSDSANEYFCYGLAEEIVRALSHTENLKVVGRHSAFSLKGKGVDVREIGQTLNVEAVLEGSVRKSGNRMRITVQLISARNGNQLWSERYDREMHDTRSVPNDITRAVVAALEVKLRGRNQAAVFTQHTESSKAHQLYLKGLFHAIRFTAEGFRTGVDYLNKAIAEDPNYALAYAGLADAYYHASSVHLRPTEAFIQVKAAAEKALALDEHLAEAHALLAVVAANYDRRPAEAERRFKHALELAPNSVMAHQWYGYQLMTQGRLAAAIGEFCKASELDPLCPSLRVLTSVTYFFARQPHKALLEARRAIALAEDYWFGYWSAALAYEQMGRLLESLAQLEKAADLGSSPWVTALRSRVYAKLGQREIAEKFCAEASEKAATHWVAPYLVATVYFALDDKDRGFEWLEGAFVDHDEALNFMAVDPVLDVWRRDQRFMDLLRRTGLEQSNGRTHFVVPVSEPCVSAEHLP
jgi:TolB-like protein